MLDLLVVKFLNGSECTMNISKRCAAEAIGTFWLVFGGCGSAVLAAAFYTQANQIPINLGIGLLGVSFAFGLTVMTMAYAIGHISGCHLNPAVTIGLCVAKRFPSKDVVPYIIAQVVGALLGSLTLYFILQGKDGFEDIGDFASNGFDAHSPGKFSLASALVAEVVLTFFFLMIILGATDKRAPAGFAPIAIGLGLTLIHLIGIPVTNLSVNPARSTGPAVMVWIFSGEMWAVTQLWLFWVAPILGAFLAGVAYPQISDDVK